MPGTTSDPRLFARAAAAARVHAETVDPAAMSPFVRRAFTDELYAAHARVFDGVSRAKFDAYVVSSDAERTRIQVYRADDRIVGYAAIHFFRRQFDGRDVWIVRGETGVEKAHRGRTVMGPFFLAEIMMHLLRHPFAQTCGLGCIVHPAAFRHVLHHVSSAFPTPARDTPPEIEALMQTLAEDFGLARIEGASWDVRSVGWISRETRGDASQWMERSRDDAGTRFFLERNPHYARGQGLLTWVPVSPRVLAGAGLAFGRRMIGRRFGV